MFCIAMPSFVCGCACEKLEEILISKDVKISYGAKVYNVANYCIVYPPVPPAKLVIPKVERKLDKISKDISERKIQNIIFFINDNKVIFALKIHSLTIYFKGSIILI